MARRKSTLKQRKKRQSITLRKRGGSRTEIASLFPEGGYDAFDWNFYYVSGHGGLSETMFEIPANTYILNIATTGKGCGVFNWDIERIVFAKDDTPAALDEQKRVIYDKLVEGITKNTLENAERIYTDKDIKRNIEELYNSGSKLEGRRTLAYYEPGDYMFDTNLYFRNNSFPLFLMGIYSLPIKQSIWKRVIDANKPIWKDGKRPDANYYDFTDLTGSPEIPEDKSMDDLIYEGDKIFNVPENLARDVMYPNGVLFPSVSTYESLVLTGENPASISIDLYSTKNLNTMINTLFPKGESQQNKAAKFPSRLASLTPPSVNRGFLTKPTAYPYLTPTRKVPTLFDVIQHLNHDDTKPKLIIVHTCRSILSELSKKNFAPSVARRMSIATRERIYPRQATATQAANLARLRSQLRRQFLEKLQDSIDRRLSTTTEQDLKQKLENAKIYLKKILKDKVFNFRTLRDVLRYIHSNKLVGLQDKFVELLELEKPLPPQPIDTTSYAEKVSAYLKRVADSEREERSIAKKVESLDTYTEEQEEAIYQFMGDMIGKTGGELARNPTDMSAIYWDMVQEYVKDPSKPYLHVFPLDKVLATMNHSAIRSTGIDITPTGIIKV